MSLPNLQPTLTGARVLIRPLERTDWADLYAAGSDPEIWRGHPDHDRHVEANFRQVFEGAISSGSAFAIVDRTSGRIVGSSRYHGWDAHAREVEIGWTFLARDYWGGSYNAEVKRLMLDHAFTFADTVVFWVAVSNGRSQRAVEKLGGVRREGWFKRGHAPDRQYVVFEIRKP